MNIKFMLLFCIILFSSLYSQTAIAVMELQGAGIDKDNLSGLTNRLRTELFKTGEFNVIERSQMNMVLEEQGFQQSGCISSECAVEVGQLIGADKIVVGDIDKIGNIYVTDIRLVDVTTGKIDRIATTDCESCSIAEVLRNSIHSTAQILAKKNSNGSGTSIPTLTPVGSNSFNGNGAVELITHKDNIILVDGDTVGRGSRLIQDLKPGKHTLAIASSYNNKVRPRTIFVRPNETIRRRVGDIRPYFDAMYSVTLLPFKNYEEKTLLSHGSTLNIGVKIKRHRVAGTFTLAVHKEFTSNVYNPSNELVVQPYESQTLKGGGIVHEFSIIQNNLVDLSMGSSVGYWKSGHIARYSEPIYRGAWGPVTSVRIGNKTFSYIIQYRLLLIAKDQPYLMKNYSNTFMSGVSIKF